ncbi:phospho-sugar mutase [Ruania zhangjianzhongii]|uniref:phospho-sugar mutase n=1 Tax=Ruania zhangjianzhongii TaxID=2603206 RepID=UPI0011CA583B|nr:phospho-sugar mutase [Ruania zhangjianzhongii]
MTLLDRVRTWIADDPDPATAAELTALLDTAGGTGPAAEEALGELADRFSGPLTFGTAGLRGRLGAGPHRMNRAVVIRAAAGLVGYLTEALGSGQHPVVVIGYDARYGSADFATDTADVVAAAGGRALLLPGPLPTPVLAYAVRALEADAGVMVTASHNPPQDNGYKVYLGGRVVTDAGQGAQIVPPHDEKIAEAIAAVPAVAAVPRSAEDAHRSGGRRELLEPALVEDYLARAAGTQVSPDQPLRVVLTSMHGVGGQLAQRALEGAGSEVHPVPEQAEPDPDFPTVAFPNPEEPGALDLALALAREVRADLVIANDPDADRCSAAIPDPAAEGGWRQLTGDEVGAILGQDAAERLVAAGEQRVLASSVVSSQLLAAIAAEHGLEHRATLTGFKWISRVPDLAYGYEEALGYCTDPDAVRDKDGISAAVRLARLAGARKAEGGSLQSLLDELAVRHGVHATAPVTVRVEDSGDIAVLMDRLRTAPPQTLVGSAVVQRVDLTRGSDDLPPTDALVLATEAGDRVIVRPSGTEPKLKCYLEVIEPVSGPETLTQSRARATGRLQQLRTEVSAAVSL